MDGIIALGLHPLPEGLVIVVPRVIVRVREGKRRILIPIPVSAYVAAIISMAMARTMMRFGAIALCAVICTAFH